jgi:hypothetical protein
MDTLKVSIHRAIFMERPYTLVYTVVDDANVHRHLFAFALKENEERPNVELISHFMYGGARNCDFILMPGWVGARLVRYLMEHVVEQRLILENHIDEPPLLVNDCNDVPVRDM